MGRKTELGELLLGMGRTGLLVLVSLIFLAGCASKKPEFVSATPPAAEPAAGEPTPTRRVETVIAERLYLRLLPTIDSKVIGMAVKRDSVEVKDQRRNWVKVVMQDGKVGWVHAPGALTGFTEPGRKKEPFLAPAQESEEKKDPSVPTVTAGESSPKGGGGPEKPQRAASGSVEGIQVSTDSRGSASAKPETVAREAPIPGESESPRDLVAGGGDKLPGYYGDKEKSTGQGAGEEKARLSTIIVKGKPNQRSVSIKSAPLSISSEITTVLPGTRLQKLAKEGQWYKVKSSAGVGYLHEEFVQEAAD